MRIISLSPAISEILFAIGAGSDIVANTYLCDYPSEAKKLPKVGSFSSVNFEKIKELNPDLIITSTVVQQKICTELKHMDLPVLHTDPRSLDNIIASIELIGEKVHKSAEAQKVTNAMKNNLKKLQQNKTKKKPRIYIEEWYQPPMYSGNWVPDLVVLAGGIYFKPADNDISKETLTKELLSFDPEIIFVSYCGFGTKSDPQKVLQREGWSHVAAVKSKKVFAINETILNRPGPRILEAVEEIRRYIHFQIYERKVASHRKEK